jgi:hypothetical protein
MVTVGDGPTMIGVGVGVAHWQHPELPSLGASQCRTSPCGQVGGFWMHCPHVMRSQNGRIVGQGSHVSAQYGVPVGAHVGVRNPGVSVDVRRGDGVAGVVSVVRVGRGLGIGVGGNVCVTVGRGVDMT